MSTITIERTARKPHMCDRCKRSIPPGARYIEWKLTPGDSEIGNEHWWCARVHATYIDCESYPCEVRCGLDRESQVPCRICEVAE